MAGGSNGKPDDGALSPDEVAALHNVTVTTIYRAVAKGEFDGVWRDGRRVRIPREAAEAWAPGTPGQRRPVVFSHKLQAKVSKEQLARFRSRKEEGESDSDALRRMCCGEG